MSLGEISRNSSFLQISDFLPDEWRHHNGGQGACCECDDAASRNTVRDDEIDESHRAERIRLKHLWPGEARIHGKIGNLFCRNVFILNITLLH